MKQQEMIDSLRSGPIPYRMVGDKLQVMDMSLMAGGLRSLFDEHGMFIGGKTEGPVIAEPSPPDVRTKSEREEAPVKKGKK